MSRLFRPKKPIVSSLGLLLSTVGATLMLIGFFLPLVVEWLPFWQKGVPSIDHQLSQWDLIKSFSSSPLFAIFLMFPFLTALVGLSISLVTIILQRQEPFLTHWKRYIAGAGALLELLMAPFLFSISGLMNVDTLSRGSGFVLLVTGSLVLFVGLCLE